MADVRFIRKNGRIIPIRTDHTNTQKALHVAARGISVGEGIVDAAGLGALGAAAVSKVIGGPSSSLIKTAAKLGALSFGLSYAGLGARVAEKAEAKTRGNKSFGSGLTKDYSAYGKAFAATAAPILGYQAYKLYKGVGSWGKFAGAAKTIGSSAVTGAKVAMKSHAVGLMGKLKFLGGLVGG